MSPSAQIYTVVGILDGEYSVRVHDRVPASSPEAAYDAVVATIPTRFARTSPGSRELLGAAVFDGALRCAHRGRINGPWGEDRCGLWRRPGDGAERWLTVVAIDPASRAVQVRSGLWSEAGNAERDRAFDFFFVASVLEGCRQPCWVRENALTPRETSRNERITAMLRYSPHYLDYYGSEAPMHMPA